MRADGDDLQMVSKDEFRIGVRDTSLMTNQCNTDVTHQGAVVSMPWRCVRRRYMSMDTLFPSLLQLIQQAQLLVLFLKQCLVKSHADCKQNYSRRIVSSKEKKSSFYTAAFYIFIDSIHY